MNHLYYSTNSGGSFRLLNSEIGNDPSNIKMASEWGVRPYDNAQKAGQKHPAFQPFYNQVMTDKIGKKYIINLFNII